MTHDLTPSTFAGVDEELVSAPRLDNLCSSWAGLSALIAAGSDSARPGSQVPLLVLFDHEEIGSTSSTGAESALLRSEEHTFELQSLMRISYAAFCLKKKNTV